MREPPERLEVIAVLDPNPRYAGTSHDEATARAMGFRAALIPGAFVYGHVTRMAVQGWGEDWLARGRASVRFRRPVYDGDPLLIERGPLETRRGRLHRRRVGRRRPITGEVVLDGSFGLGRQSASPAGRTISSTASRSEDTGGRGQVSGGPAPRNRRDRPVGRHGWAVPRRLSRDGADLPRAKADPFRLPGAADDVPRSGEFRAADAGDLRRGRRAESLPRSDRQPLLDFGPGHPGLGKPRQALLRERRMADRRRLPPCRPPSQAKSLRNRAAERRGFPNGHSARSGRRNENPETRNVLQQDHRLRPGDRGQRAIGLGASLHLQCRHHLRGVPSPGRTPCARHGRARFRRYARTDQRARAQVSRHLLAPGDERTRHRALGPAW